MVPVSSANGLNWTLLIVPSFLPTVSADRRGDHSRILHKRACGSHREVTHLPR